MRRKRKEYEELEDCREVLEWSFRIKIEMLGTEEDEGVRANTDSVCFYQEGENIYKGSIQNADSKEDLLTMPATPGHPINKHKSSESIDSISSIIGKSHKKEVHTGHVGKEGEGEGETHGEEHHVRFKLSSDVPENPESPKLRRSGRDKSRGREGSQSKGFSLWDYLCC